MKAWIVFKKAVPQSMQAMEQALSSDNVEHIELATSKFYLNAAHAKERQMAMMELIKDLGFWPFYTAGIAQIEIDETKIV